MPPKGYKCSDVQKQRMSEAQKKCKRITWNKGKKHSIESRKKMSDAHKGVKLSEETKRRMSIAQMGHPVSQKLIEHITNLNKGKKRSKTHQENLSKALQNPSLETRALWSKAKMGTKASPETRAKLSAMRQGKNNSNWKGGISTSRDKLRGSTEFKEWRIAVFERDNYTCQKCGVRGGELNAHHIIHLALDVSKATDVDNGITLCVECHKLEHPHLCGGKNARR